MKYTQVPNSSYEVFQQKDAAEDAVNTFMEEKEFLYGFYVDECGNCAGSVKILSQIHFIRQ